MFFNFNKKKQEPKKIDLEDIYKIFDYKKSILSEKDITPVQKKLSLEYTDDNEGLTKRFFSPSVR